MDIATAILFAVLMSFITGILVAMFIVNHYRRRLQKIGDAVSELRRSYLPVTRNKPQPVYDQDNVPSEDWYTRGRS